MSLAMFWKAYSKQEINEKVNAALAQNANYAKGEVIGTPATYLDQKEFYPDATFLDEAPFLKTLISNPNHIGCHTLDKQSSPIFKGTQAIERRLISLCAEEIFKAETNSIDGYVATGGTEANIQALWIYRNYFMKEYGAKASQVGVLFSEDTHYSVTKGCDLLGLEPVMLTVNEESRQIKIDDLVEKFRLSGQQGVRYFIVLLNMSTTMFGSVDDLEPIVTFLDQENAVFKLHLDAAFGGFIYPFTNPDSNHNFSHSRVSSISIDAHKMLQTPYGTGLFLIRKGFMQYVANQKAQYVPGLDYTLCGSRSGANAIVIWMLLKNYGSKGWTKKIEQLIQRTDYLCQQLKSKQVRFYRNPFLNIVAIRASDISVEVAKKYELVADSYEGRPNWWKIVVMDHVSEDLIAKFLEELTVPLSL